MLFVPQQSGSQVAVAGEHWQPRRSAAAERQPAHDFLTLPAIDPAVRASAVMRWNVETQVAGLISAQFESGALKPRDVRVFSGAGNALAEGFFAWAKRQTPLFRRLNFNFVICDLEAVREQIQYQYDASDFEPTSCVYLGIEMQEESIFEIGERANKLRAVHPRLLASALTLINRAAGRTIWVRTPDELLGMFASWYWEGNSHAADDDVLEELKDRFGDDEAEIENYLPSVVRPELCPEDLDVCGWNQRKKRFEHKPALGVAALRRLQRFNSGWTGRLCLELEELTSLLQKAGNRSLFDCAVRPECAYAAATLIAEDGPHIGALLDDHYEHLAQSGEGSTFYGFVPFASTPDAIRKQYADWSLGLSILGQLDRVLATLAA